MNNEDLSLMGGGVSQPRDVTSNPDVLKTLRHLNNKSSDVVIVESGKTDSNWWRKWSNGFIEQGGASQKYGLGKVVVNFAQPFSNEETITVCLGTRSSYFADSTISCVKSVSTSNMAVMNGSNVNIGFYWYATGY